MRSFLAAIALVAVLSAVAVSGASVFTGGKVTALPNTNFTLSSDQYAGYITVDEETNGQRTVFFFFFFFFFFVFFFFFCCVVFHRPGDDGIDLVASSVPTHTCTHSPPNTCTLTTTRMHTHTLALPRSVLLVLRVPERSRQRPRCAVDDWRPRLLFRGMMVGGCGVRL